MTIRDATIKDLESIVKIYNSTIESRMVTADVEEVTVSSREKWFLDHSPNFRPIWVAEEKNIITGWLSFQSFYGRPAYNETVEISIYIHKDHRKKGLGEILLLKALNYCPVLNIRTVLGFIFGHNAPSINLFQKHGFKVWGNLPGVAKLDGIERDVLILGKKIN